MVHTVQVQAVGGERQIGALRVGAEFSPGKFKNRIGPA